MRAVFVTAPILAQPIAQSENDYGNNNIVVYTPIYIRARAAHEAADGAVSVSRAVFLL
jgi:hypothetical protein